MKASGVSRSRNRVSCPGFPEGLFYYSYDGTWEGTYNRLYIVADGKDQVVSIQLVDETPGPGHCRELNKWHTYNFVNYRVKALSTLCIDHKVSDARRGYIIVDSTLVDSTTDKTLEVVK